MLDALAEDAGPSGASSLYLAPGNPADGAALAATGWADAVAEYGELALRDGCGLAGLRAGHRGLLVAPPFPVRDTFVSLDWDDGPLRELLDADFNVGVVLVRLGRFSVAVFRGGELVDSKTDSRYVKGKHHAGGTSQLRYTRVRDGQIKRLYDKVCEETRAHLMPPAVKLDYLVLGGERFTLNGLVKGCPARGVDGCHHAETAAERPRPETDTLPQVAEMLTESRVWELKFDC